MPDLTVSSNDLSDPIIENQTVVNTNDGVISQCLTVQDKALLNVGGVRHEGLICLFSKEKRKVYLF